MQQQGCVIWLTGLSGAGKSTVGCALEQELFRRGGFPVLLDGDNVRSALRSLMSNRAILYSAAYHAVARWRSVSIWSTLVDNWVIQRRLPFTYH